MNNEFEKWQEKCKESGNKRNDYLTWDEYFMAIAKLSSKRSKDPNTQVGACIVSNDNRILSIGEKIYTKYPYVCHAEMNAILNYRGTKKEFENAKIYVDLFPCNECAKLIIQSGIKEVIYLSDKYNGTDENIASKRLFDTCKVKYKQIECKEITI